MAPSVQRRIENAKQRLKGRKPLVFEIRLVPQSAGGEATTSGLLYHSDNLLGLLRCVA